MSTQPGWQEPAHATTVGGAQRTVFARTLSPRHSAKELETQENKSHGSELHSDFATAATVLAASMLNARQEQAANAPDTRRYGLRCITKSMAKGQPLILIQRRPFGSGDMFSGYLA